MAPYVGDVLADDLHAIGPHELGPPGTTRALEDEVLLGTGEIQLVDAVVRDGGRRNPPDVLVDLTREPLQRKPNLLQTQFKLANLLYIVSLGLAICY